MLALLMVLIQLAGARKDRGNVAEAARLLDEALELRAQRLGADRPLSAQLRLERQQLSR